MPLSPEKKNPSPAKRTAGMMRKPDKKSHQQRILLLAQELITAATHGNHAKLKKSLEHGAPVNVKQSTGMTALMIAAFKGNTNSVDTLLRHKANVNLTTPAGQTALYLAALQGQEGIISQLLAHKADPNIRTTNGDTPLGQAIDNYSQSPIKSQYPRAVDALLKSKANVHQSHERYMPLWLAAHGGNPQTVSLLLAAGALVSHATVTATKKNGPTFTFTAIQAARESGHKKIAQMLEGALQKERQADHRKAPPTIYAKPQKHKALTPLSPNLKPRAKISRVGTISGATGVISGDLSIPVCC